jgi:drug/metabolite transporter (DMT)-like permease
LKIPKGRALLGAILFGALTIGIAFVLIAWGLVILPASLYQILMALIPLFTLMLSVLQGIESFTPRGIVGSLLAVLGIAIAVGGMDSALISIPHILAIIAAAIALSQGGVLIKKFPPNPPVMTNAIGMSVGAIILAIASLLNKEAWNFPTQTETWIAY